VLLDSRGGAPDEGWDLEDNDKGPWVVLFAVGRSPREHRLIGGVRHQAYHNFCD
jgi:hypothetical protein